MPDSGVKLILNFQDQWQKQWATMGLVGTVLMLTHQPWSHQGFSLGFLYEPTKCWPETNRMPSTSLEKMGLSKIYMNWIFRFWEMASYAILHETGRRELYHKWEKEFRAIIKEEHSWLFTGRIWWVLVRERRMSLSSSLLGSVIIVGNDCPVQVFGFYNLSFCLLILQLFSPLSSSILLSFLIYWFISNSFCLKHTSYFEINMHTIFLLNYTQTIFRSLDNSLTFN